MDNTIGFEIGDEELDASFEEHIEVHYPLSYNALSDKPRINGIELVGDVSLDDFGVVGKDVTIAGIPLGDGIAKEDLKEKLDVYDNIGDFPDAKDYVKATDVESEDIDFNSFDW